MSRTDKLALFLSLFAVFAAWLVAQQVFENIPHLEDEIAYVWQAKIMAAGEVMIPTPVEPGKFLIPFVVDYEGQRFGKYPLGWPALLAIGIKLGIREWVNPLLAGLAVWLTYVLGKKLMGEVVGFLAALLTVTSPFFLVNVGALLSHAWGLVLSLGFVLGWWGMEGKAEEVRKRGSEEAKEIEGEVVQKGRGERVRWLAAVTAGAALGMLVVTRPFSGVGVALPFGVLGLYWLVKGPNGLRWRVLTVGIMAVLMGSLVFLWQAVATGDPFLNPYTLWWPYDKIGFGPGVGVAENGHTLRQAWVNTKGALRVAYSDVFGWPMISWIFLPFGLWASRENGRMLWTGSVFASLLWLYMAYWIGAWLFGPRYQFEGLYSLTLLSAAGMAWLGGWGRRDEGGGRKDEEGEEVLVESGDPARAETVLWVNWRKGRALGMTAVVAGLFAVNLCFYLPARLDFMFGLYGISAARMAPFLTPEAQTLTPAVIVVMAEHWTDYGNLLELEDPFLTTPFIFTFGDKHTLKDALREVFPERVVYYYYIDKEPYKFFTARVPELEE